MILGDDRAKTGPVAKGTASGIACAGCEAPASGKALRRLAALVGPGPDDAGLRLAALPAPAGQEDTTLNGSAGGPAMEPEGRPRSRACVLRRPLRRRDRQDLIVRPLPHGDGFELGQRTVLLRLVPPQVLQFL